LHDGGESARVLVVYNLKGKGGRKEEYGSFASEGAGKEGLPHFLPKDVSTDGL